MCPSRRHSVSRLPLLLAVGLLLTARAVLSVPPVRAAAPPVHFEVQGEVGRRVLSDCQRAWSDQCDDMAAALLPPGVEPRTVRCLLLDSDEFQRLFGRRIPDWGVGIALDGGEVVAVDCGRQVGVGPGLETVFLHEMTHALLFQAAGDADLPTWFHEGVAQRYSGQWRFVDTVSVIMNGTLPSLGRLRGAFPSPGPWAAQAYRTSLLAVDSLRRWHGEDIVVRLLSAARESGDFDEAFSSVTDETGDEFATRFARSMHMRFGWLVTMTRWPGLFAMLAVLFSIGAVVRIARNRRRLAAMEDSPGQPGPPPA